MSAEEHEQIKANSYKNLEDARKKKNNGLYDSEATRQRITNIIKEKMNGREPYKWQLDVGEALHMKLDTVVIAGTGAGKTLPFIIPIILGGMVIIISPLNALQDDQVSKRLKFHLRLFELRYSKGAAIQGSRVEGGRSQRHDMVGFSREGASLRTYFSYPYADSSLDRNSNDTSTI